MCGSKTTETTTIPPPSPEELAMMNLATDGLMTAYLNDAGYDVTKTMGSYQDDPEYASLQTQKSSIQEQINSLNGQLQGATSNQQQQQIMMQMNGLNTQMNDAVNKEINLASKPQSIQYKVNKKPEVAAQEALFNQKTTAIQMQSFDIAEKFLKGDMSFTSGQQEFMDSVLGPMKQAGLDAVKYLKDAAGITKESMEAAISGVETQVKATGAAGEADIGKIGEEVKATGAAGEADLGKVGAQVKDTGAKMLEALAKYKDQIKQTGLSMGDAILDFSENVKKTGADMGAAIEESLSSSKALMEMGITDFNLEVKKQMSAQAASLGRSVTDPEFINEMQQQVNKNICQASLQFGALSAQQKAEVALQTGLGMQEASKLKLAAAQQTGAGLEAAEQMGMGIAQQTGQGLENVAMQKFGLGQQTGQGLQNIAQMKFGLGQETGLGLQNIAQMKLGLAEKMGGMGEQAALMAGQYGMGAAQAGADLKSQLGLVLPSSLIGIGQGIGQQQFAQNQAQLGNLQAGFAMPMSVAEMGLKERMAQTTKVTQKSGGVGGFLGGLIGTGLGVAGMFSGGSPFFGKKPGPG